MSQASENVQRANCVWQAYAAIARHERSEQVLTHSSAKKLAREEPSLERRSHSGTNTRQLGAHKTLPVRDMAIGARRQVEQLTKNSKQCDILFKLKLEFDKANKNRK